MLEFYWAYVDYQTLMTFTEELLATVAQQVTGGTECQFGGHAISLAAPFRRAVAAARRCRGRHAPGWAAR